MAISFIDQASAASNTVTLPTTVTVGDFILIFAYANSAVSPTLPAGYTSISSQFANSNGFRSGYKFAAGGDSSGTWTNATEIISVIYRGVRGIGTGAGSSTNAASTSAAFVGIGTFTDTSGKSWAVSYGGSAQSTSMSTPTGGTLRSTGTGSGQMAIVFDSNAGVSVWGQHTSTLGVSAVSGGGSVELLAASTIWSNSNNYQFVKSGDGMSVSEKIR